MQKDPYTNPYKFIGPLDPKEDSLICMPREKEIAKVIGGILSGDFWTILGPQQIGKTTFLRQLMNELSVHHCIYINFEVSPKNDEKFYNWIIQRIVQTTPDESHSGLITKWESFGPELNFFNFLEQYPTHGDKKIIFFFDEMEKATCARSFLHLWRKVFHERYHRPILRHYAVVIAGKVDLSSLTTGETSPFNIARKLELGNLSGAESENLILAPCEQQKVELMPGALQYINAHIDGHPQLLQHLCHILCETVHENNKTSISITDVENAIKRVLIENDNLKALERELKANKTLENLSQYILDGQQRDYIPYRDLSITGTGPIVQDGRYCRIRNKIYETMIKNVLDSFVDEEDEIYVLSNSERIDEADLPLDVMLPDFDQEVLLYEVNIFLKEPARQLPSEEEETKFLKCLFDINTTQLQLKKGRELLREFNLNRTEKLIFFYLAYENYKARRCGDSSAMRQYHLSSVPRNNIKQEPEWEIFVESVNREGNLSQNSAAPDPTIRQAVFSIRKKLRNIDAEAMIPRQKPGSGEGYWLKGIVNFHCTEKSEN
jgi:hypothetical protein